MVQELKVRKIGNSIGVLLPKEVLAHLRVEEGDMVSLTSASDGSVRISPSNAEFAKQMEVVHDVIHRYRNTLRELAK